jgi:hypothetical protein
MEQEEGCSVKVLIHLSLDIISNKGHGSFGGMGAYSPGHQVSRSHSWSHWAVDSSHDHHTVTDLQRKHDVVQWISPMRKLDCCPFHFWLCIISSEATIKHSSLYSSTELADWHHCTAFKHVPCPPAWQIVLCCLKTTTPQPSFALSQHVKSNAFHLTTNLTGLGIAPNASSICDFFS